MAVKLRLTRMGRKKRPFYRIVAVDSRKRRDGGYIEAIGTYNPLNHPASYSVEREAALKWLRVGAQPSDTVRSLLSRSGVMLAWDLEKRKVSQEEIDGAVEEHLARHRDKADRIVSERQRADEQARRAAAKAEKEAKAAAEVAEAAAESYTKAEAEAPSDEAPETAAEAESEAEATGEAEEKPGEEGEGEAESPPEADAQAEAEADSGENKDA